MRTKEIETLLSAYWLGETSEEEEKLLRHYLETESLPPHLKTDQEYLRALHQETPVEVPPQLEQRLEQLINNRSKRIRLWRWGSGIAATLLLTVGTTYSLTERQTPPPKDTFTNPEEAYATLQATLLKLSNNLNSGLGLFYSTQEELTKINQQVQNELQ
jgi:hypothetical protein